MHPPNPTHLRTIHPLALAELGEEACIVALGVARDLRSGVIPPEEFNMCTSCGTACCIAGHIALRSFTDCVALDVLVNAQYRLFLSGSDHVALGDLFSGDHPSDPILAADAIERYVYDGSQTPWVA